MYDHTSLPWAKILVGPFSKSYLYYWCLFLVIFIHWPLLQPQCFPIHPTCTLILEWSSLLYWGFFPLLQEFLIKTCCYHFKLFVALVWFNTSQNLTSQPHAFHALSWWQPQFVLNRKTVEVNIKQRAANYNLQVKSGPVFLFCFVFCIAYDLKMGFTFYKVWGGNQKKCYFMAWKFNFQHP